ncbi:MAG: GvpL/GvpF family gas vesicle protein [Gemmatimonadaceae bacterium]
MVSATTSPVWYVYGVVPASLSPAAAPAGLDDADVRVEPLGDDGEPAALVSALDGDRYAPASLEKTSGEVEWLSPRALAHDRVLTWASDAGTVVPLPMFSLFSGPDAVRTMLRDRSAELTATLRRLARGREYALRVYRVDSELLGAMTTLSPRIAEIAASAAAASPGQRYLLERKLETEKKAELRSVTQALVDEIVTALAPQSLSSVQSPIPRLSDAGAAARGVLVLNAAFFVAPRAMDGFQRTLTALVERHGTQGLRFDFTGPWPPYHFVTETDRNA